MKDLKKDQEKRFKNLDVAWRSEVEGLKTSAEVRDRIVKAAVANVELDIAKEFDEDLRTLTEQLNTARAIYKDGKKENNLRIEFAIAVLRSRGEDVPSIEDFMNEARQGKKAPGF